MSSFYTHELDDISDQAVFYLASQDIISVEKPRKCSEVREVSGMREGARYLYAKVDPPIISQFEDEPPTEFDHVILNLIGGRTLSDIGIFFVMADIVIFQTYTGEPVNERMCSRIGIGTLHATYADALAHSILED